MYLHGVSIHTATVEASRVYSTLALGLALGLVWLGFGLASQASRVYLRGVSIHTATVETSRVYSISLSSLHVVCGSCNAGNVSQCCSSPACDSNTLCLYAITNPRAMLMLPAANARQTT